MTDKDLERANDIKSKISFREDEIRIIESYIRCKDNRIISIKCFNTSKTIVDVGLNDVRDLLKITLAKIKLDIKNLQIEFDNI